MLITSIVLWLITQRKSWFISSLVTCLLLLTVFSFKLIHRNQLKSITFYSIPNHWAIDFNSIGSTTMLSDLELAADQALMDYQVSPNRLMNGWQIGPKDELVKEDIFIGEVINFYGSRILIANKPIEHDDIPAFINYSLIPRNKYRNGEVLLDYSTVIYKDGSKNNMVHDLRKEGALIIDL
jgi:hypothetical protein